MKIRKATRKDLNEIAKLSYEYEKYENSLDKNIKITSLKENRKSSEYFMKLGTIDFILEEDSKIQGLLSVNIRKQGKEKKGVLHTLIITKDARGRGYGEALVKHAIEFFKKNKCKRLDTFVHFKNKGAKKFWEKQGFEMELAYVASRNL